MKSQAALLYPELLRKNIAVVSFLALLGALPCFLPRSSFSQIFSCTALAAGVVHLAAYFAFPRFKDQPLFFISLSWFDIAALAFIVSDTGGIFSPFIFLIYWTIISAAIYGIEDRWLPLFAAACYLLAVYAGIPGLIGQAPTVPGLTYGSRFATTVVSGINCFYILLAGFGSRYIISGVLAKAELSRLKHEELGNKYKELLPYSQIGELTHRMAHDLRTPLASAMGYLELKAGRASNPEDAEIVESIKDSLKQMSSILTQITCYGRRSDLKREKVELKALLTGVKTMVSFHPAAAGVKIAAHFPDGEIHVHMSRQELQLVFFNIIKNALDAVGSQEEKSVSVVLRFSGAQAEVEVSDTGPGIPEEMLPRLLHGGGTSKPDGTGVGLAIIRDFIHGNGGTFEIGNGPGKGAVVKIRLPVQAPV